MERGRKIALAVGILCSSLCLFIFWIPASSSDPRPAAVEKYTLSGNKTSSDVVVAILSHPKDFDRRNAARRTYLSRISDHSAVSVWFLMTENRRALPEDVEKQVLLESDLLWFPLSDDPRRGAFSVQAVQQFVQWSERRDFKFLFKTDDETYVQLPLLLDTLRKLPAVAVYWGSFLRNARVVKEDGMEPGQLLFEDLKYKKDRNAVLYPPFARGVGYAMSKQVAHFLSQKVLPFRAWLRDDYTIGTWLTPYNITRINDDRVAEAPSSCKPDSIILGGLTAAEMDRVDRRIEANSEIC